MKKLIIALACAMFLVLTSLALTSFKPSPASSTPTLKKTAGGLGSEITVYEYRSSEGYTYIIVQGNGQAGPVSTFR